MKKKQAEEAMPVADVCVCVGERGRDITPKYSILVNGMHLYALFSASTSCSIDRRRITAPSIPRLKQRGSLREVKKPAHPERSQSPYVNAFSMLLPVFIICTLDRRCWLLTLFFWCGARPHEEGLAGGI